MPHSHFTTSQQHKHNSFMNAHIGIHSLSQRKPMYAASEYLKSPRAESLTSLLCTHACSAFLPIYLLTSKTFSCFLPPSRPPFPSSLSLYPSVSLSLCRIDSQIDRPMNRQTNLCMHARTHARSRQTQTHTSIIHTIIQSMQRCIKESAQTKRQAQSCRACTYTNVHPHARTHMQKRAYTKLCP